MSGQIVPGNLIHQHCKCKKTACATAMCSCFKLKMSCTELYAWISCENCETDPDDESDYETDIDPESNVEDCLPTTFKTTTKKFSWFLITLQLIYMCAKIIIPFDNLVNSWDKALNLDQNIWIYTLFIRWNLLFANDTYFFIIIIFFSFNTLLLILYKLYYH